MKTKSRETTYRSIVEKCSKNQKFGREIASFYGDNLLDKIPKSNHWWSWTKRLPDLCRLTFGEILNDKNDN